MEYIVYVKETSSSDPLKYVLEYSYCGKSRSWINSSNGSLHVFSIDLNIHNIYQTRKEVLQINGKNSDWLNFYKKKKKKVRPVDLINRRFKIYQDEPSVIMYHNNPKIYRQGKNQTA